jgi:hypothetical protein
MDHRRLDAFARLLATRTRRGVLQAMGGAILAGHIAARRARAQNRGIVVPGGACSTNADCAIQGAGGEPGICADNGFASDGALNCCGEQGLCCQSDAECCGDLRCAPTGDVCYVCAQPPFPTRMLGQPCAADAECVPAASAALTRCVNDHCANASYPTAPIATLPDAETALAAAETLSRLEASGQFDALYDRMHPDAQAIVPRSAVVGWYRDAFAPHGPHPTEAIKVRFLDWTWPVTGKTYAQTADVAYRQDFADGLMVRDEVRLVKGADGGWRWFFGRDRAFVEEQIARYGG